MGNAHPEGEALKVAMQAKITSTWKGRLIKKLAIILETG